MSDDDEGMDADSEEGLHGKLCRVAGRISASGAVPAQPRYWKNSRRLL